MVRELAGRVPAGRLIRCAYLNPVGAVGWWLFFRVMNRAAVSEGDSGLFNRLIPYIAWLDALGLPFGQSLLFVLERR